ncbi:MAG: cyanophycinase [Deltaproteobacteria bacterium]|nr:cyanophycinase [Deltaproteobacteria bacterium]
MCPSPELPDTPRGYIIPIGGAEDKISDRTILKRFVQLCGGRSARIAIIPTASELSTTGSKYEEVFSSLGVKRARELPYKTRSDTERTDWMEELTTATGVFLTGGAQLRLSTILGGTEVAQVMRRRNARGVHIAGTSAGAAFVSEHMIAVGKGGATPRAGQVVLAPGLGLTNRIIVDQHFRQRDRLGRILAAIAYNPFAIGCGFDENTAGFIGPDNVMEIVGEGAITILDVSQLQHSGMATAEHNQPVNLIGVRLHVLTHGARYDLEKRNAAPPPAAATDD